MSHGDKVSEIPQGFVTVAQTPSCAHGAMANEEKKFYGVQFHPELKSRPHNPHPLFVSFIEACIRKNK